jgi:molecular chaperone GrpE (heat shock protein)
MLGSIATLAFVVLPCLQSGYKIHDRILRAAKVIVFQE